MAEKEGQEPFYREVRLSENYPFDGYTDFQANYVHSKKFRPMRSSRVYVGDRLAVEVNSLGCFGPEPAADLGLVGLFGDSVVQGMVMYGARGFAADVHMPGYEVVNGGIEGAELSVIVDHCLEVHRRRPLACAAVHSGWHNLLYNDTAFSYWAKHFDRLDVLPAVAHFRLSADINEEAVERGYEALYVESGAERYLSTPWVGDRDKNRRFLEAIREKNKALEQYCAQRGRLLITLEEVLEPKTYAEVATHFFDAIHPRPSEYPAIGRAIAEQLGPYLERRQEQIRRFGSPATPAAGSASIPVEAASVPSEATVNPYITPNALGCYGPMPEEGALVAGLFGDDSVRGIPGEQSIADHLAIEGLQGLNGGLPGARLVEIVDHCLSVRDRTQLVCAAVHVGWEQALGKESFLFWEQQLDRLVGIPVIAHFRLTADLNDEAVARGYESLFRPGTAGDLGYRQTHWAASTRSLAEFKSLIDKRNKLLERYCQWRGRILIDLDRVLSPKTYEEVSSRFFDLTNPRPAVYPEIAKSISEALGPAVAGALAQGKVKTSPAATPVAAPPKGNDVLEDHGSVYPLW